MVDDASQDGTADAIVDQYGDDPRILILRQQQNRGPAAARNRAIAHVTSPYFAILDSDDYFLPHRFTALFEQPDFDIWADNILFTNQEKIGTQSAGLLTGTGQQSAGSQDGISWPSLSGGGLGAGDLIDSLSFVRGNLTKRGRRRHQLGFCKPVLRTDFVRRCGVTYDETLRLGEDFVYLMYLLAAGARFRFSRHCGYVAIERHDSLSARHSLLDLRNLLATEVRLLANFPAGSAEYMAMSRRRRETQCKVNHVHALERRRAVGAVPAMVELTRLPLRQVADVLLAWCRDKLRALQSRVTAFQSRRVIGNQPVEALPFGYLLIPTGARRP